MVGYANRSAESTVAVVHIGIMAVAVLFRVSRHVFQKSADFQIKIVPCFVLGVNIYDKKSITGLWFKTRARGYAY